MSILDKVKEHPYLYGGVALLAVLFVLYEVEGSSASASGDPTSDVDAETAAAENLQAQQNQINGALQQSSLQLSAQQDEDATGLQEYTLQQQTAANANSLAAQVTDLQNTLTAQTTQTADTLQASVDNNQIAAQQNETDTATAANAQNYSTLASALIAESTNQTNAEIAGFQEQGSVADTAINAQLAESSCHGIGCWI